MMKKSVLVIDDDPFFKLIIKKLFQRSGHFEKQHFLNNGEEAIQFINKAYTLQEPLPDIIILDIEMPVMNGWGFMNEFVKLPDAVKNSTTIYIVSSSIAQSDKEKSATYPEIKAYLTKPLSEDVIGNIAQAV